MTTRLSMFLTLTVLAACIGIVRAAEPEPAPAWQTGIFVPPPVSVLKEKFDAKCRINGKVNRHCATEAILHSWTLEGIGDCIKNARRGPYVAADKSSRDKLKDCVEDFNAALTFFDLK